MRLLPLVTVSFLLGALVGLPGDPVHVAVLVGLAVALAWVLAARGRRGAVVTALIAAYGIGALRRESVPQLVPRVIAANDTRLVRAVVEEGCTVDGERTRCIVRERDGTRAALSTPAGACTARPGDTIDAVGEVRPIAPVVNGPRAGPGATLVRRGIAWSIRSEACVRTGFQGSPLALVRRAGMHVRDALVRGLAVALPVRAADRARALLFGDRTALDDTEAEQFRRSGLAHLLAVSGAHVSLLAGLLRAVLDRLFRRSRWITTHGWLEPLATLVPLPPLVVFVAATGESASALRALCGAWITALGALSGRRAEPETVVAASAALTAAWSPSLVLDVGWQLSVTAAWALAARPSDAVGDLSSSTETTGIFHALSRTATDALGASVRVAVIVAPVLLWHFGRAPFTALVANVLAAPLAEAVALPCTLVAAALGLLVPPVAHVLAWPLARMLDALFALPALALALPFATVSLPPPAPATVLVVLLASLVALRVPWRARLVVFVATVLFVLPIELVTLARAHPTGHLRITALDVGQGDAIVIDLPDGAAMLVDAGGVVTGGPDPGARTVVPWLLDHRRTHLVALVASHPHPDHIGGLPAVLAAVSVDALWDTRQGEHFATTAGTYGALRSAARSAQVPVLGPEHLCIPPRDFHGIVLEVLAPCPAVRDGTAPNDASFVLRLRYGRASVLLPGDLERGGEARIRDRLGHVTVLKVGHHGSRTSTTEALLDRLRPRVALVSAGHPSTFGHPHADVLERLERHGVSWFGTPDDGAVTVTLDADGHYAAGSVARGAVVSGLDDGT